MKSESTNSTYYRHLMEKVIELSEIKIWSLAVKEWIIYRCDVDMSCETTCVCGKENLKYLFTIKNRLNGNILFPIGSVCINRFKRSDLDFELSIYNDMHNLLSAVNKNEYIELSSKYFTRNLLLYLYNNGAFVPSKYNYFNAKLDYQFMLDMFNKRKKEDITETQSKKIKAIIINHIIPFIQERIKINDPKSLTKAETDAIKEAQSNDAVQITRDLSKNLIYILHKIKTKYHRISNMLESEPENIAFGLQMLNKDIDYLESIIDDCAIIDTYTFSKLCTKCRPVDKLDSGFEEFYYHASYLVDMCKTSYTERLSRFKEDHTSLANYISELNIDSDIKDKLISLCARISDCLAIFEHNILTPINSIVFN